MVTNRGRRDHPLWVVLGDRSASFSESPEKALTDVTDISGAGETGWPALQELARKGPTSHYAIGFRLQLRPAPGALRLPGENREPRVGGPWTRPGGTSGGDSPAAEQTAGAALYGDEYKDPHLGQSHACAISKHLRERGRTPGRQ